jgi:hypothetical protein
LVNGNLSAIRSDVTVQPAPSAITRLEDKARAQNVLLTSEVETITFTTDGEKLWVKTDKE